jgi:hypothetical protein
VGHHEFRVWAPQLPKKAVEQLDREPALFDEVD